MRRAAAGIAVAAMTGAGAVPVVMAAEDTAAALYERGVRLANAEGVPRDTATATRLYCRAAAAGEPRAMFAIAWMYLNGRGAEQDDGQGAAWLDDAAAAGHPTAAALRTKLGAVEADARARCPQPETPPATAAGGPLPLRPPAALGRLAGAIADEHGLDPALVQAVITVESSWRPRAVSQANAQGLMQLIPATAARFGVDDPFDPAQNIRGGVQYLRWLLALFKGDVTRTLAAYNAGEQAVLRYGGIPPYSETQRYVVKVRRYYPAKRHPFDPAVLESPRTVQIASVKSIERKE